MLQLLEQDLLIVSFHRLPLPLKGHRCDGLHFHFCCVFICIGARSVNSTWASGQDFDFIAHANNAAGARDQVLTKIDIAVILRGSE
ncbi:hypothetical protein D3C80_1409080 [compost metagenome]